MDWTHENDRRVLALMASLDAEGELREVKAHQKAVARARWQQPLPMRKTWAPPRAFAALYHQPRGHAVRPGSRSGGLWRRCAGKMTAVERLPGPPYAQVAVDTALTVSGVAFAPDEAEGEQDDPGHLQRTFHYAIPASLRGQVAPGQLVWAPFGARQLQGIVVALDVTAPVEETKELLALIDAERRSLRAVGVAQWISARYLTRYSPRSLPCAAGMQRAPKNAMPGARHHCAGLTPAQRDCTTCGRPWRPHRGRTGAPGPPPTWRQHLRALVGVDTSPDRDAGGPRPAPFETLARCCRLTAARGRRARHVQLACWSCWRSASDRIGRDAPR